MTVIRHNSISGIVSITAAAGSNLSFYDSTGSNLSLDTGNINDTDARDTYKRF